MLLWKTGMKLQAVIVLSIILGIYSVKSQAQEMLGITNSKYNATHSAILNPALPVLSPYYLDINFVTVHAFVQNNYIYINKEEDKFNRFLKGEVSDPDSRYYKDYYTSTLKHGYINFRLLGPSFTIIAGNNAFGLSFSARSVTSVRNFSKPVAKFFFEGLYFPPQYDIRYDKREKMTFASMGWGEIALNFSRIIQNRGLDMWSVGTSFKLLPSYAGAYAFSNHVDFEVPNYDTLIVYEVDAEAGLSLPFNYDNDEFQKSPLFRGFGAGIDIGVVYLRKKVTGKSDLDIRRLCAQNYHPYLWRIGFSLLDIGSVHFKGNAKKLSVTDGEFFWPGINTLQYTSINGMISELSNRFYNDPDELVTDDEFNISLPAAVSLNGDYNITTNWFASSVIFLPLKLSHAAVVRSSLFSGGIRYENRHFQIGTIVSLDDKNVIHVGLNSRIGNFFIGSENVLSFLKISDFTGTDLYAGIKLSFFKGKCPRYSGPDCNFEEYEKFKR